MKILIGADLVPTKSNFELFNNADTDALLGKELKELLNSADYTIFNLEVPLADEETPIEKNGPALSAPTSTVKGLKAINPHCFAIANNHILDQGEKGLFSTMDALKENGISFFGAGKTQKEAKKAHIFTVGGKTVGVYACVEHEFSVVTDKTAGANPFDPLETPDEVAELKKTCDYVTVLYHGGKEHYRYPSPRLRKVCRKLIDKGADLVICQHSHCIGAKEEYNGGTIVYGQGNFLFDMLQTECWQTGLLIKLDDDFKIEYIPVVKDKNCVRLADEKQKMEILDGFYKRSEECLSQEFVEKKYADFAETMKDYYALSLLCRKRTFLFRALNKITHGRFSKAVIKKHFTKSDKLKIINFIECEAHNELLLKGLDTIDK